MCNLVVGENYKVAYQGHEHIQNSSGLEFTMW